MTELSRRHFLGASAVAVGAAYADDKPDPKKPSGDRLRVALVGCGGMGMANLIDFVRLPDFEPVALCDPDPGRMRAAASDLEKRLKQAGRTFKEPKLEKDFRKVVEDRDVDVVIVGTPDHWHAYVLIAACAA